MNIHINMASGAHFKVESDDECNKFLNQFRADSMAPIEVMVGGWKMVLSRPHIEAVSINERPRP